MMESTLVQSTLQQAVEIVRGNIPRFGDRYPHNGEGTTYILTENNHWMTSFWTGQLWLAYAVTGEDAFRREAERRLASFAQRLANRIHENHDLGFLYTLSARAQWQLTGDEAARQLGIDAAERLITRFHAKGEYIQAWGEMNDPVEGGRMIVDCLMNLPLLFWASDETGDPKFAEIAAKHAQTSLRYLVRPGDHTYHTFFFDQATGEPLGGRTAQGYSDDSLWSRGQAWAIYGFALASEWTGEHDLLDTSRRLAERFWSELGDDLVPLWDFRVPHHGPRKRDSSAGAIAACGMFRLAALSDDIEESTRWRQRAREITARLTDACFETAPDAQGLLRDSSYNVSTHTAVEQYMPFGDYFFLESLVTLSGKTPDFWGKARLNERAQQG
ncbi:MAG: glycoside hydrolase family 88 protein [Anaerolineae bacterium]|nr:glycoside hydrolase family 88 protein [Anaerolineae bacterium]